LKIGSVEGARNRALFLLARSHAAQLRVGRAKGARLANSSGVQNTHLRRRPLQGVGEEIGGLDAAGGEVGDEVAVGGEEIVIGEFAGEDPGDLFEDAGGDVGLGVLGGEEMDFEFFGRVGVLVADAGDFDGFDEGNAEFFAEFAGEGLFESFGRADFAAGEFPFERRGVASAALADEEAAVGALDDGGDDVEHGGNISWYGLTTQCGAEGSRLR
jgi:hypothetical protein